MTMTKVLMRRWFRGAILLLVLGAALGIGGAELVRVSRPREVTFDDLKLGLTREKTYDASQLTEKVKQLDGKTIRIRGFIYPSVCERTVSQFVLARDYDADVMDAALLVDLAPPVIVNFVLHAIDVEGIFSLREYKTPEGEVYAIYHLAGKKVELVPGVKVPRSKNGC
jgi:hypothetical protein